MKPEFETQLPDLKKQPLFETLTPDWTPNSKALKQTWKSTLCLKPEFEIVHLVWNGKPIETWVFQNPNLIWSTNAGFEPTNSKPCLKPKVSIETLIKIINRTKSQTNVDVNTETWSEILIQSQA